MNDLDLSWFVRQEVIDDVDKNAHSIATRIIEQNLDPECEEAFEIAGEFLGWEDYTDEEFEYLIRLIIASCSLISMKNKGLVEEVGRGSYKLTNLGNCVSEALEKKHAEDNA